MGLAVVSFQKLLQENVYHQHAQVILEAFLLAVPRDLQQLLLVRTRELCLHPVHVLVSELLLVQQVVHHVHRVVAESHVRLAFSDEIP